jgi:hypothetical protein
MKLEIPFRFDCANECSLEHALVLRISRGIRSKEELLSIYSKAGSFPEYFGYNWDAFEEFLRDFSWTDAPAVAIKHEDLPLLDNLRALRTYLQILSLAMRDPSNKQQQLIVFFPTEVRGELIRVLGDP